MLDASRVHSVSSLDDPRLACYRNLKDRELAREGGVFIAEGELIVRRLLESGWPVESLLLSPRMLDQLEPLAASGVPVYVLPDAMLGQIVGFAFHLGVLACGRRVAWPTLEQAARQWGRRATVLVLPGIANTENLGALLRIAAGFGAEAALLGPRCGDVLYRQCVRVSMGAVFRLPIVQCDRLERDLRALREDWGFELVAAVLEADAQPLHQAQRPDRLALMLGNEAKGLSPEHLALCHRRLTIPMQCGTDSLNVAIAAAVFLYHFRAPARA